MLHVDVTDIPDLSQAGEYIVIPRAVFFSIGQANFPTEAQFPEIRFKVTDEEFRSLPQVPKSLLQYRYEGHLRNSMGSPRKLTEVEAELDAQNRAARRVTDAQFGAAMKAATNSGSSSNVQNTPFAAPEAMAASPLA